MSYLNSHNAISFGNLKQAAIYFDRVLPVAFRCLRTTERGVVIDVPEEAPIEAVSQLIYGENEPDWKIMLYLEHHWSPFIVRIGKHLSRPMDSMDPELYGEVKGLYLNNHVTAKSGSVRADFAQFASKLGFSYSSLLLSGENTPKSAVSDIYTTITMSNVPLIDVSNASWEQIMELRRDPDARRKLRRLRLFLYENYVGKEKAFIEDDLAQRLDDYESSRRSLGLRATTSVLSVVFDAKALQASVAAGIAAALFGGPVAGLASATAVECGKIAIEIAKRQQEVHDLQQGHDLAFIIDATMKLS